MLISQARLAYERHRADLRDDGPQAFEGKLAMLCLRVDLLLGDGLLDGLETVVVAHVSTTLVVPRVQDLQLVYHRANAWARPAETRL